MLIRKLGGTENPGPFDLFPQHKEKSAARVKGAPSKPSTGGGRASAADRRAALLGYKAAKESHEGGKKK